MGRDGCCELLIAAADCCWLLLNAAGSCWLVLAAPSRCWLLLSAAGCCCWLVLAAPSCWLIDADTTDAAVVAEADNAANAMKKQNKYNASVDHELLALQ
jgi:hypothetical protein